jgi:cytochrome c oxidase accessory protein FixG
MATTSTPSSKPPSSAPPPPPPRHYHAKRKQIHLICFLVFLVLPFFNIVRFDIPKQRFFFAGQELWINEFAIIFFAMMFLLFTIAAASMLYGRVYCSYMCPQMIFSEASLALEDKLRRFVNKHFIQWSVTVRTWVARAAFYSVLLVASVFLSFAFIAYFVEPRDLLGRLMQLDLITAGGMAGAVTTLITFLDFAFVRQRFCTTICPYGYLQGMLADKQTLLVVYRDGEQGKKACIECGKCVRICHMGIDIRKSPFQIECIHCGECVEACDDVLARLKKPGLIHYTWGEQGEMLGVSGQPWYKRLGLRDAKRFGVGLVMLFYASGLTVALSMRQQVQVRINPDRTVLFQVSDTGEIVNRFRLEIANRGSQDTEVEIRIEGLPQAHLVLPRNPIPVKAGEELKTSFAVAAAPGAAAAGVNYFQLVSQVKGKESAEPFATTFITPQK